MSEGWIKLHRCIQEHWIWQDPQKLKWWLDILLLANHKDKKIVLGNELKEIEKGEHHTSILKLADRWKVDRKTVSRFLDVLERDGMITVKRTAKGTTIKVSNYATYQAISEGEEDNKKGNKVPSKSHQSPSEWDTNKNDKNDKNVKNNIFIPPSLEEVAEYCKSRSNNIEPQRFIDFYSSKGWMIGKNKMKDWKAAIRNWERNNKKDEPEPKPKRIVR